MAQNAPNKMECCGFSKVNRQGQMQIPADWRKALGFDEDTPLMLFADIAKKQLLVTIKPLDEDLLTLATRAKK